MLRVLRHTLHTQRWWQKMTRHKGNNNKKQQKQTIFTIILKYIEHIVDAWQVSSHIGTKLWCEMKCASIQAAHWAELATDINFDELLCAQKKTHIFVLPSSENEHCVHGKLYKNQVEYCFFLKNRGGRGARQREVEDKIHYNLNTKQIKLCLHVMLLFHILFPADVCSDR